MTLKYLEGFESCRTDADLRSRNIINTAATQNAVAIPSTTGTAGFGVAQLAAANTTHNVTPFFSTGPGTFGWWTGITANAAWTAGGFTLSISGRSNLGTTLSYGTGNSANCNQICFDGTRYWAIQYNGSTYVVAYSADLQNWTTAPSQPPGGVDVFASVIHMGSGVVAVGRMTTSSATYNVYYTNNLGITWNTQALITSGASTANYSLGVPTTNSTYPHAFYSFGTSTTNGVFVGTLGGTMTQVVTSTLTPAALARPRLNSGLINFMGSTAAGAGTLFTATAASATLNTSAAWSTATFTGVVTVNDIAYNPTSNLWVMVASSGVWTFPNTGVAGTAVAPTGALTVTQRYSTAGIQNVFWTGTQLVGFGLLGHIITSADGITWSELGSRVIPVGTSGTDWRSAIYDGTQYVICTDATNGCIATTPDGANNYQCQYTSDKAFSASTTTDSNAIFVIPVLQTTMPAIPSGALTSTSGNRFYGVAPSAVTSGVISAYTVLNNFGTGTTAVQTNVVASGVTTRQQATHYYELVYTKSTSATNAFTFQLYIDGTLAYGPSPVVQMAATTDTTSILFAGLPTTQCISQFDDLQLNLVDGSGMSGAQGLLNILPIRPATDVQAQWVKTGTAASNSLSVATTALSSVPGNYVSSANSGDKDIYKYSTTLPTGYTVRGIQADAIMTKTTTTSPVVNIGVVSGSTESDSANVTLATQNIATLVSLPLDKNPNGNVAWTSAAVQASEVVLNHVT